MPRADLGLFYRHSGRFPAWGLLLLVGGGSLVAWPVGLLYGAATVFFPFVQLTALLTAAVALGLGWLARGLALRGKIRNTPVVAAGGGLIGLTALVAAWTGWVAALSWGRPTLWLFLPSELFRFAGAVWSQGVWSVGSGGPVRGWPLVAVWSVEALLLVLPVVLVPAHAVARRPFSEGADAWAREERLLPPLTFLPPEARPAFVDRLRAGDFGVLASLEPVGEEAPAWTRYRVRSVEAEPDAAFLTVTTAESRATGAGDLLVEHACLARNLVIDGGSLELLEEIAAAPDGPPDASGRVTRSGEVAST